MDLNVWQWDCVVVIGGGEETGNVTFEQYVSARLTALVRLAGVLSGDHGVAEDVVQEVLLRVSARWQQIGALEAPDAYVRRMVVNEYLSWQRKWRRSRFRPLTEIDASSPDPAQLHAERDALLRRIDQLTPKQRAVIVLRFYEGLPDTDIASVLSCSVSTVRSHASRALSALRVDGTQEHTFPNTASAAQASQLTTHLTEKDQS